MKFRIDATRTYDVVKFNEKYGEKLKNLNIKILRSEVRKNRIGVPYWNDISVITISNLENLMAIVRECNEDIILSEYKDDDFPNIKYQIEIYDGYRE